MGATELLAPVADVRLAILSEWSAAAANREPDQILHLTSPDHGPPADVLQDPLAVRKAALLTAAIGLVHSLLLVAGSLILKTQTPGIAASDEELVAFFEDPDQRRSVVIAGLYLIPFAGIAFVWFFVALRMWISASAPRLNVMLSNVQLVSGIIYTTLVLAAGGAMSVMAATIELSGGAVDPAIARQFPQYGASLLLVFAMRMAAMFVLTTTNLGRLSGILPRWFVVMGFAVAIMLLFTSSFSSWLVFVFPAWILVFSAILVDRARRISPDLVVSDPGELAKLRRIHRP
jgi:hypothetical protein